MALEALLFFVRSRVIWPLMLASQRWKANPLVKMSSATYAAEITRLRKLYEKPMPSSTPMVSPTLTLVDCPECDGAGALDTLTSGAVHNGILQKRMCNSCAGVGRVERQKRAELLQRQARLIAASEPATAEFIGGPLDGQLQQLSEPLPTFTWAQALPLDWAMINQEAEPDTFPQVDEYTYERQGYNSSHGNAVYLCME